MELQDYLLQLKQKKKSLKFDKFLLEVNEVGDCPVKITNKIIGGKWKPVIFNLILNDVNRFGELNHLISGISKKVLTEQLRQMENDGLLIRKDYDQKPLKIEYKFTDKGLSLIPIINEMCNWALDVPKSAN